MWLSDPEMQSNNPGPVLVDLLMKLVYESGT